jgi:hypothetical protein
MKTERPVPPDQPSLMPDVFSRVPGGPLLFVRMPLNGPLKKAVRAVVLKV